jgi:phosphoglycolate phosphatase
MAATVHARKAVKLVIFDVDGTLVDSQDLIVAAQREAFAAQGLPAPSRQRALSVVGLSLPEAFTALAGSHGRVEDLAASYKDAFGRLRADPAYHEPLFPGAAELIADLAYEDGVALGIATGKSRRGVAHLVQRHGWDRIFATVQTADDAPSKPDPTMLRQAMSEVDAAPEHSLMIGDSTFDMEMARAAGVTPIGVSWGYHPVAALEGSGAAAVVQTYGELRALLIRRGVLTASPTAIRAPICP